MSTRAKPSGLRGNIIKFATVGAMVAMPLAAASVPAYAAPSAPAGHGAPPVDTPIPPPPPPPAYQYSNDNDWWNYVGGDGGGGGGG